MSNQNLEELNKLYKSVRKGSFLDKCLKLINDSEGAELRIDDYESHHLLRFMNKPLASCIMCTTRQARQLSKFAQEDELIPAFGWKYHFYNRKNHAKEKK